MADKHGEKRPATQQTSLLEGVKALLVDVEGVTTPVTFVKDILIPYAKENLKTFLEANFDKEKVQISIGNIRTKAAVSKEAEDGGAAVVPAADAPKDEVIEAVAAHITSKLNDSFTDDALRPLLELVLEDGYKLTTIQGEVYDDVVPLFQMLVTDGVKIFSFSADSSEAQKLLFSFSNQGDIFELFAGQFEPRDGDRSKDGFLRLAEAMEHQPSEILYLCQHFSDARAAHSAGFKTCVVVRETSDPSTEDQPSDCNVIYSLEELWDEYSGRDVPLKRLHPDYYGEYSTDGATNDSEVVTGGEDGPDEQYGHSYDDDDEPPEILGEEENGDSQDA